MKSVFTNTKKVILMVAMMATVMGYANEISLIKYGKDLRKTALTITNVKEGNLLSIKDNRGITLYKKAIEQTGVYNKGFDLTDLPDGNYFFELEKDIEIQSIPFTVNNGGVDFNNAKATTIYKPFVRQKDGLVYITKLSLKSEPLKISVFNASQSSNDLLHTETIKNTQNIERVYRLGKGNYKLVFHYENKKTIKYINN